MSHNLFAGIISLASILMLFIGFFQKMVKSAPSFDASQETLADGKPFTDAMNQLTDASRSVLDAVSKSTEYSIRSNATAIEIYRYGTLVKACHTNEQIVSFGVQYKLIR